MSQASYPTIAADETHHLAGGGSPAYVARFIRVGKFHDPGLAPAFDASGAFHITQNGKAAYLFRFCAAFGFYEGLAAVRSDDAWFHIREAGLRAYPEDYAWCGNFQEGRCPVRTIEGRYLHVDRSGTPAYAERHLYAGDFRDGIACVRLASGLCAHVDRSGSFIHSARFLDLDVFHKGFARARDGRGWFHVNRSGQPAYDHRFAELEPFYNGQAHALGFDGQRLIVDEGGATRLRILVAGVESVSDSGNDRSILVLIGAPGAGKTTLAQALRDRTGLRFSSIDGERAIHGDGSTAGEMRAWASFLGQIEEGTCDVVEFSGSGPLVWHLKQAIKNAVRPCRVVWIQSPLEICVARVRARDSRVPYPFRAETPVETTIKLHARLECEIANEMYWKSDYVTRVDGRLSIEAQVDAVIHLVGSPMPKEN
jgi:adenylate kinase family enzyme